MNAFEQLLTALSSRGNGEIKVFGYDMYPEIKNGGLVSYEKATTYEINDIVFCKVGGRFFAAQRIGDIDPVRGYLVVNSIGWATGWTKDVYGRVTMAQYNGAITYVRT